MKYSIALYSYLFFLFFGNIALVHAQPKNIVQAEYFWNTDPGQGNGTPLIAEDGNFNDALEKIIANTATFPSSSGAHKLNIRLRDAQNRWSPVFSTIIDVLPASASSIRSVQITSAEYFWDTDPGQGNGTPMIAFDGNFNDAIEKVTANITALPAVGVRKFNVRVRDGQNQWSPVFSTVIDVLSAAASSIPALRVTAAEYFFNTDPGQGNATPMLAFDGNFNQSLKKIIGASIPAPVVAGVNVLSLRTRDGQNQWGALFSVVVNIDTTIGGFNTSVSGATELCFSSRNGIQYNAPARPNNTFDWTITGGTIVSGTGTAQITVNWNTTGPYQLSLTECDPQSSFCDDATITVVIKTETSATVNQTICAGQSFAGYTSAGSYTDVFTGSNGCDSTRILNLTVTPTLTQTVNMTICNGQSYAGYTSAGTYIDNFTTASGCDSIRTLHLTVSSTLTQTVNMTICSGQSFAGYNATGNYTDNFTTASGCDSTRFLNLTVLPPDTTRLTVGICQGQSFAGYNQTGVYADSYTTLAGCDSVRVLTLTVSSSIQMVINTTICKGENVAGYTQTGSYTDTYTATGGCDSTRILNLTVLLPDTVTIDTAICYGSSLAGYTTAGTYTDVFNRQGACDSVRILILDVLQASADTSYISICEGDSIFAAGAWQFTQGLYADTVSSSGGCYEIQFTALSLLNLPDTPVISLNGLVLSVPPVYSSYQWYLNGAFIPGASGSSVAAVANGDYTIVVSNADGCSITSEAYNVVISNIEALTEKISVSCYPNPSDNIAWILINGLPSADATLVNPLGQQIQTFKLTNNNPYLLDFQNMASGVYLVKIQFEDLVFFERIVIQR